MATIAELVGSGELVKPYVLLESNELPGRQIYLSSGLSHWIEDELPYLAPDWSKKIHPLEQVEDIFHRWITDKPMARGRQMKLLEPVQNSVWEMRTVDVRIIGYFARKAVFVGVKGAMKNSLKRRKDYTPHVTDVEAFRDKLPLDAPKYMTETILGKLL